MHFDMNQCSMSERSPHPRDLPKVSGGVGVCVAWAGFPRRSCGPGALTLVGDPPRSEEGFGPLTVRLTDSQHAKSRCQPCRGPAEAFGPRGLPFPSISFPPVNGDQSHAALVGWLTGGTAAPRAASSVFGSE